MLWTVSNSDDLGRLLAHLGNMPHPFSVVIGTVRRRTLNQNAILHKWFAEIAKHRGDVSEAEVKAECNLTYGVPIKRRDSQEWASAFAYLFDSLSHPAKLKALRVLDIPVTRDMTTKQLSEYMDQMTRDYREQGVILTDPELMKWENN